MATRDRLSVADFWRGRGLRRMAGAVVGAGALLSAAVAGAEMRTASVSSRQAVDASQYPWSAIGRLNAGGRGFCTAFLVGEREVLTAAHCLYDQRSGRWWNAVDLHFVAGYQRDQYLVDSAVEGFITADDFVPTPQPRRQAAGADWALVRLKEPVGRRAGYLGLMPLDRTAIARLARDRGQLVQAGYRADAAHAITISRDCSVLGLIGGSDAVMHDCPVLKGDSGSPILALGNGQARVVGIHIWRAEGKNGTNGGAAVTTAAMVRQELRPRAAGAILSQVPPGRPGRPPAVGSDRMVPILAAPAMVEIAPQQILAERGLAAPFLAADPDPSAGDHDLRLQTTIGVIGR